MKFLPIHVSTLSHCLLLVVVIIILRNYISSLRGELFYVISNHSCLDNLKRYESHCKIEIPLHWFSLHQWYCRALKLPVHTLSVDFSLALLSAFGSALYSFSSSVLLYSSLGEGTTSVSDAVTEYSEVFCCCCFFPSVSYSAGLHRLFSVGILILFLTVSNTVFGTNGGELVLWNFREIFTLCHAMDAV